MNTRAPCAIILTLLLARVIGGCASDPSAGYSFAPTYDASIGTVHVPIFENPTFDRIEVPLTRAVTNQLRAKTPWRIGSAGSSDATLHGTVVDVSMDDLSSDSSTGLVEELAISLTIDFELKDNRDGRVIAARRGFTTTASFVPARGVREPIETGQNAVIERTARDLVASLRSGW